MNIEQIKKFFPAYVDRHAQRPDDGTSHVVIHTAAGKFFGEVVCVPDLNEARAEWPHDPFLLDCLDRLVDDRGELCVILMLDAKHTQPSGHVFSYPYVFIYSSDVVAVSFATLH